METESCPVHEARQKKSALQRQEMRKTGWHNTVVFINDIMGEKWAVGKWEYPVLPMQNRILSAILAVAKIATGLCGDV